ncbi:MAG: DUF1501 domain-containing protein [Spirochaetales bacterium]|nr:DUF1501 domain-containing protein [Leptospiraceae bacterium]MCP5481908.1 DUF1501 domain-containing protein [Spirochaetales bacterium]
MFIKKNRSKQALESRASFLKKLGLAFGSGLGLVAFGGPIARRTRAEGISDLCLPSRARSVIFLNMAGGMSHVDSLDPKPGNGPFGRVRSSINGVELSDRLPQTARELRRINIVRSLYSRQGDHSRASHLIHTGHDMMGGFRDQPCFGAVIAAAKHDPAQPFFPDHITLGGRGGMIGRGGFLGTRFDSFHVGNPDRPLQNLTPPGRPNEASYYRRSRMVELLDQNFAARVQSPQTRVWQEMHTAALDFMNSDRLAVFEIERESEALRRRFGNTATGKSLLLAKRLAEARVPFIEVTVGGWDTHNNNRNKLTELFGQLDAPFAALLGELGSSGLLDETLVVFNSEFGRTPRISSNGDGRDHHPRAWSALIGGGGLPAGAVIGQTDEHANEPRGEGVHAKDFVATIYRAAGLDPTGSLYNSQGRPMQLVPDARPIPEFSAG